MERSAHRSRAGAAISDPSLPVVAIVDSEPEVCAWLLAQLEPSDCRCVCIELQQFASGARAFAALQRNDVRLIVYDIGPLYVQNQLRFRQLADAAMGQSVELIITNVLRWMAEERELSPSTPVSELLPAAGGRVLRQIRRLLARGDTAPAPKDGP